MNAIPHQWVNFYCDVSAEAARRLAAYIRKGRCFEPTDDECSQEIENLYNMLLNALERFPPQVKTWPLPPDNSDLF